MKKLLLLIVVTIIVLVSSGQTFQVSLTAGGANLPITGNTINHPVLNAVSNFIFQVNGAPAGTTYNLFLDGANPITYTGSGSATISWPAVNDLRGHNISVLQVGGGTVLTIQFTVQAAAPAPGAPVNTPPVTTTPEIVIRAGTPASEEEFIKSRIPSADKNLVQTQFGTQILGSPNRLTEYTGKRYVHIFFDQYGNSVLGAVPQGISNLQYVIHVIYLTPVNKPDAIRYVINQTTGEYNDAALYRNVGILDSLSMFQFRSGQIAATGNRIEFEFKSKELLFSTSTSNISFTVNRLKIEDFQTYKTTTTTLGSFTIKMAPVYAGSFDIGLIATQLENPNYSLVNSATDPANKVVKKSNSGTRGVVTVMATLYVSPFTIVKSLIDDGNVPWYKLTGRSFLDYSGNIFERVFPALGVGFTDQTFENLFFGANIEVARGGSVFIGYHYGKVNTFEAPEGFEYGSTVITEDEFNLRTGTAWKGGFAIGANIDLRIVLNLFRAGGTRQ